MDKSPAKPLTRTTVLDKIPIDARPEVRIDRHLPDWNTLARDVAGRIEMVLKQEATGYWYFNPAVTVTCLQPSQEFFRIVRKEQAHWCRYASNTIPGSNRRSSSRWTGGGQWITNKYARYLDRALSFTGILFIDGQLIPHHSWPKPPEVTSTKRLKITCTANPLQSPDSSRSR